MAPTKKPAYTTSCIFLFFLITSPCMVIVQ
jgi:hypothetical protein